MPDITVLGAGIFGLSVAWACQGRGANVRVIDPGGPGAGASGGVVGALAPHVPENWNDKKAFQLDSLLMAEPFWHEVEAVSGISPGYARLGRLQPIPDAAALTLARARAETAKTLWQDKARWQVTAAARSRLGPGHAHRPPDPRHAQRPHPPAPRLRRAGRGNHHPRRRGSDRGQTAGHGDPRHRRGRA